MNNVHLILAAGAGMLLGGVFFGGLWWTVRKCLTSLHPASWLLGSAFLRMSIAVLGFYFVGGGQWQRMLACLVGFITARLVVTWLSKDRKVSAVLDETTNPSRQSHAGFVASSTTTRLPIAESCGERQETHHAS